MNPASAFELIKWQKIKETKTDARFYRHKKTGAEILSMINDDENKVFGITFRTPPKDSTGVAHILEHSVLCGSRKYPVKEPFVELLKGSLQTFLNAFTYPDKTCYPVASQNLQDLYNLIDVYLDAVFNPALTPHVYHQEGWHYEYDESSQSLIYKGVVYNEMKGVYSSPSSLLMSLSGRSLFPDTTYGLDSGGDPDHIPDLTYEALTEFHKKYYHPSNSRIYFYGNDNPEKRLALINEYLKNYDKMEIDSGISLQNRFQTPVNLEFPFVSSEEEGKEPKGMITLNWLLPETSDAEMNFAFHILEYVLIGMPASPLRKAMVDSGLGEGLAGVGLENELRQMYFSTGLKGIDIKNARIIEELILKTLESIVRDKIDPLTVEAAINTIEFNLREQNTGGFPRGLSQMLLALTSWLYDADPMTLLAFEAPLENVKTKIKNEPDFLEKIIETHLLKNLHRTTVTLVPDPELSRSHLESERKKLQEIKSGLTPDNNQKIIVEAAELKKKQETPDSPEALSKIPVLKISDLDKVNKTIPLAQQDILGTGVLYHDIFTNNIFYLDIGFDIHTLPQKYIPYIPLFGQALLEMGTEKEDYVKFSQRISGKTGGIRRGYFTSMLKNSGTGTAWLFLRCKAMLDQADELFSILKDMLLQVKLDDRERFKQIVLQMKTGREQGIIPQGNKIVTLRLRADYNEADWASEQINGISSIFFLRALLDRIENDWAGVLSDLETMKMILVNRAALIINVTLDGKSWQLNEEKLNAFLGEIPENKIDRAAWTPEKQPELEGMIIPSKVNFVGKSINLFDSGYEYHASAHVIVRYLRTTWLWERVRMQGGAYGAMCGFDEMTGIFTMVSYRDPGLTATIDIYDKTAEYLNTANLTDDEVTKCIIGVIGDIDSHMLPDARGYASMLRMLSGNTEEIRQQRRNEVLKTEKSHFSAFADILNQFKDRGHIKVLGGQDSIEDAKKSNYGILSLIKIM